MRSRHAIVLGASLAGLTVAHLLRRCSWRVDLVGPPPVVCRWITLSEPTQWLLNDLWGASVLQSCQRYQLCGRRVAWSTGDAVDFAAPLLAVEVASLATAMRRTLLESARDALVCRDTPPSQDDPSPLVDECLLVDARGRTPSMLATNRTRAGNRQMRVWPPIELKSPLGAVAEVLSGRGFWSFAFPLSDNRICLQIAKPQPYGWADLHETLWYDDAVATSSILRRAIRHLPETFSDTCIAPSLGSAVPASARLVIGDALMNLDPICGDGVGHALKSALLAVATANSVRVSTSEARAVSHFNRRAIFAFRAHLDHCCSYYGSIRHPDLWAQELDLMNAVANTIEVAGRSGERLILRASAPQRGLSVPARDLDLLLVARDAGEAI